MNESATTTAVALHRRGAVPPQPGRLLTIGEAAKACGVCYETMRKLIVVEGKIPHHRPSERTIRVYEDDLNEYLAACRRG